MIAETIATIHLHMKRAEQARAQAKEFTPLNAKLFEDFEKVKVMDTFIYRFIKTQDLINQKLFKEFLDAVGEYQDSISLLDQLDRLEKLKIIDSSASWMEFRNLRNTLTHEYPGNEKELVEGITLAFDVFDSMKHCFQKIEQKVSAQGIV